MEANLEFTPENQYIDWAKKLINDTPKPKTEKTVDRIKAKLASLILSRNFGESINDFFERRKDIQLFSEFCQGL